MNLSETAFLLPVDDAWSLRWFTPSVEGRTLRARDARVGARALGDRAAGHRRPGSFRDPQRRALRGARRRPHRARLSGEVGGSRGKHHPGCSKRSASNTRSASTGTSSTSWSRWPTRPPSLRWRPSTSVWASSRPRRDRHCAPPTRRASTRISCRGSSLPAPASTKTRSPARRIAHSRRSGRRASDAPSSPAYQASRRGGFVHTRVVGDRVILGGQAVTVLRRRARGLVGPVAGAVPRERAGHVDVDLAAERATTMWCTPSVFMGKRSSV